MDIIQSTIGQSQNPVWHRARRFKITASLFGDVLDAIDRPTPTKISNIVGTITGTWNLYSNLSIRPFLDWGHDHEDEAIQVYKVKTSSSIEKTGLWIFDDYPFLGASPDGLVLNWEGARMGLVEIKCPYSLRENLISEKPPAYLDKTTLGLKPNHKYYHQIQGQMFATKLPWCDFVIWTPKDLLVQRIFADPDWPRQAIPKLVEFYETHLRPKLV